MLQEFEEISKKFATYGPQVSSVSDAAWAAVSKKIQIIIPAGGESKRLRGVTPAGYNKISMPLPNGDTLIEYNIRMYRDAGLKDFILLIGHEADSVKGLIGDGSKLGVRVVYSHDADKPLATGGSIRTALDHGLIDKEKYMIVHNGGDIFIGYPGSLPHELVAHHLDFEKQGSIGTILSAPMSLVQGSILKIIDGFVDTITYEAYVPIPYHTAATIFSPGIYDYFEKFFVLGEKMEFEKNLFPILAHEHKLTAMKVDNQYFLPVKNEKQWEQLMALFAKK